MSLYDMSHYVGGVSLPSLGFHFIRLFSDYLSTVSVTWQDYCEWQTWGDTEVIVVY